MKKCILLLTALIALSLAGCDAADNGVTHRDGNLIVTNYSDYEITDITISHLGKTVSVSPAPIKNTQICYFTLAPPLIMFIKFLLWTGRGRSIGGNLPILFLKIRKS